MRSWRLPFAACGVALAGCGSSLTAGSRAEPTSPTSVNTAVDGTLDCASDVTMNQFGDFAADASGQPTADAAAADVLAPLERAYGGVIKMTDAFSGSLVIDQREQIRARATQARRGGWLVDLVQSCEGYQT